jgi:hypothetical protein
MTRKLFLLVGVALLSMAFTSVARAETSAGELASWNFDVYLNDKKVGKHEFKVIEAGGTRHVQSEASFTYRILLIPAYRYEHTAAERWNDNCLVEFDASTNANGERIEVSGERAGTGFVVEKDGAPVELPECVMTFAYWTPDFLAQSRLLNPQTGDYVDVEVERLGDETLEFRGEPVAATRFKLKAYEVDLTLWYSPDDEWLGLESVAKGGHIIRYERS